MSDTTFATALDSLGTILPSDPGRDAIHLATYAITSDERLFPGQHVGILDGKGSAKAPKLIGIVDPFLATGVNPGQMFWLVLYPRSITSLRHVWEHPEFPGSYTTVAQTGQSFSEEWMRRWAIEHMSVDYYGDADTVAPEEAYANAIEAGRRLNVGPYEDARDHIDNEWWAHWESITGERGRRDEYFSCAC